MRRNYAVLAALILLVVAAGILFRLVTPPPTPYRLLYRHSGVMAHSINLDTGADTPVDGAAPFDVRTYERTSPDGKRIARSTVVTEWYWWRLELEDTASGSVQPLGEFALCDYTVSWSPDSTTLATAFLIDPNAQPTVQDFNRCEIHLYDVAAGTFNRITNNEFSEAAPAFSPDGIKLVFMSSEDGYNRLYILDLATNQRTMLTQDSFGYRPAWSPDGKWIAFMSNHVDWNDDIYIIAPDGTGLRRLTSDSRVDDYPEWVS
jgi:Tol biopolymer transport system component